MSINSKSMNKSKPLRDLLYEVIADHRYGVIDLDERVIDSVIMATANWLVPDNAPLTADERDIRDTLIAEAETAEAGNKPMPEPVVTITAMVIHPPNVNPCYGEDVIELKMVNEGRGAFFELRQEEGGPIRADLGDLQGLVSAAQRMLGQEGANG